MNVRQVLESLGYTGLLADSWYTKINHWLLWYGGKAAFHTYTVYNGEKQVECERKTLGMAKKVAEDKADLLLSEKVEITVVPKAAKKSTSGDKKGASTAFQDYLDAVFEANNFWTRGNQLVEMASALGTGAFVEYKDGDDVKINYLPAPCIWPLKSSNGVITECAFVTKDGDNTIIRCDIVADGKYIVRNYLFDKDGTQITLPEGVLPEWNTGSDKPLFQIFTPNICNNIDIANPMGVSVYANSIDDLMTIDLIYDSFFNEFNLGKKRIFVKDGMIKINTESGETVPTFDPNDTVYYSLPGEDTDKLITESNMELRIDEHIKALQAALDILSEKCGFGKGFYKFDAEGLKTATEVISQGSKLFRRVQKDEIVLHKALVDLVGAILFLGGKGEADTSVNFDDSIIEDTNAKAARAMLEKNAGIIDDVEYFMITRNLDEEAAIDLVGKIAARKPEEPPQPDLFGSGA